MRSDNVTKKDILGYPDLMFMVTELSSFWQDISAILTAYNQFAMFSDLDFHAFKSLTMELQFCIH